MLQKQLFPAQPGLRVVHDAETVDALTLADHPGGEAGRRAVLETLADSIDDATTPVVITCEHLCMPGCWIQTDAGIGRRRLSRRDINALLQGYLPPARILLIVREQRRWLPSWYQQRIKAYETQTMSQLIDSAMFRDEIVPALCYADVAAEYEAAFGPGSVSVVPFELLARRPQDFAARVLDVAGLPPELRTEPDVVQANVGMSQIGVSGRRQANRLIVAANNSRILGRDVQPMLIKGSKRLFSLDWMAIRLLGKYAQQVSLPSEVRSALATSNRDLDMRYGLDLEQYGYEMLSDTEEAGPARQAVAVGR